MRSYWRTQGHGPATVVKYHREAAAFAAWLGEKALTAERGRGVSDHLEAGTGRQIGHRGPEKGPPDVAERFTRTTTTRRFCVA